MNYEKLYKNALENAKGIINYYKEHNRGDEASIEDLEEIFPELKESEDEKIRKDIIVLVKDWWDRVNKDNISTKEQMIAWLEKQKAMGKDIIFRPLAGTDVIVAAKQALEKIEIGKEVILAFNGAYIPVNGKTVAEICNEYFAWHEKQGEQKVPINDFKARNWYVSEVDGKIHDLTYNPTNTPKVLFKKGDFVVIQETTYLISKIEGLNVTLSCNGRDCLFDIDVLKNARLWDITKDAKDGDVLYSLDSNRPFIYKERKQNEQAIAYCGLNIYGKFFVWDTKDCVITLNNCVPATKEQRDTLMKVMVEAGYEWDAEKKELKLLISNGGDFESPAWSEEDDAYKLFAISAVEDYYDRKNPLQKDLVDWLKSLKERLS